MMKQLFRFTFFLLIWLPLPLIAMAQVVAIPDPNLRASIEDALGKPSAPISQAEIARLPRLETRNANIRDLTGLEHATFLKDFRLASMNRTIPTPHSMILRSGEKT